MATISSAGSVEGVDLTRVMSNTSLSRLNTETSRQNPVEDATEISTVGMQQSAMATMAEAASRLASPHLWSSTQATSDEPATVSARTTAQTPAGDYQVEVGQLASGQTTASATFSSLSTVIGLGTLNIEIGSWNGAQTAFATNPNWPKANVVLGPKNDTLERVRDKINAAGIGVVAAVVSDATGSRLVLRSTGTGADRGFKISTEEPDSAQAPQQTERDRMALSALGFDPASTGAGGMQLLQAAQNAQAKVNNESIESPLNVIEDKTGLSLTLKRTTDKPVTVRVKPDAQGMQQAVLDFTKAYNDLQRIGGDVANVIQRGTQDLLGTPDRLSATGRALAQAGITRTPQGELQVNTRQLASALKQSQNTTRQSQTLLAQQVLADLPPVSAPDTPASRGATQQDADRASIAPSSIAGTLIRQRLLDQYQDTPGSNGSTASKSSPAQDHTQL